MPTALLRQVSIRVKLAAFAAAVIVLVVLGQTFQSLANEAVSVQEELTLRARLVVMSVASAVGPLWTEDNVPSLTPFAERISHDLDVQSLAIVSPEGAVVASQGAPVHADEIKRVIRLRLRTAPRSLLGLPMGALELAVASPILRGSEVRGYLYCAFRSSEPARRLGRLVNSAVLSALLWVALGAGLALWLTRRLTRPLVHLAEELSTLDRDGYALPPEGRADGEIGLVQDRLVDLSERLREERERVTDLTRALRHQVHVVTADLERVAAQRQTILDSVRDGIMLLDPDGTVRVANNPARKLFGSDVAQAGAPVWSRVKEPGALERAVRQATSLESEVMVHAEVVPRADERSERHLRVRVAPVVLDEGGTHAVILIAEDTTERRKLEEQMLRSERLASIGTLTAGLAHQIGNHLNAISGYAVLLKRNVGERDKLEADLSVIQKEVRSATELMDRVLLLARTRPPSRVPLEIPAVLREALDLVRVQARHGKVTIVDDLLSPGCVSEGDPQLFMQAVLNIVINAIQAMPEGGELRVSSTCTPTGQCLIHISDTGVGMSDEVKRHIFDPFFTTKPEGQGTGLGLAITQRIIELHQGTISVESAPGLGTTFVLAMPVRRDIK